jgi:hypothetical protein
VQGFIFQQDTAENGHFRFEVLGGEAVFGLFRHGAAAKGEAAPARWQGQRI